MGDGAGAAPAAEPAARAKAKGWPKGKPRAGDFPSVKPGPKGKGEKRVSLEEPLFHGFSGLFYFIALLRKEQHWAVTEPEAKQLAHYFDQALVSVPITQKWLKRAEKIAPWATFAAVLTSTVGSRVITSINAQPLYARSDSPGGAGNGVASDAGIPDIPPVPPSYGARPDPTTARTDAALRGLFDASGGSPVS